MAKNNPQKRELRKSKKKLPTLEELNFPENPKLTKPKKNNRRAIKQIEQGNRLWDIRHSERVARRKAAHKSRLTEQAHINTHRIPFETKRIIKKIAPSWDWSEDNKEIRVSNNGIIIATASEFAELITAMKKLRPGGIAIKVGNINEDQLTKLKRAAPRGSDIVSV